MNKKMNSLGFCKPPDQTRVVVAMSGGVDSSVVAAKLNGEGYNVIGITLQLYDHGANTAKKGACCAGTDIHDARRVAHHLNIPHYVLNYESIFRDSVIDEFADSYLNGATPVPCIRCNERVKFSELLTTARELDADCMATGHYIQRKVGELGVELHQARDRRRDQSYFLFSTTKPQLDFLRFPLGNLESKSLTRDIARNCGLIIAEKPDSQDICFVPNGNYAAVIEKLRPNVAASGEIVHVDGRVLGTHRGIINYTIGQRRGLGLGGLKEPVYVISMNPHSQQVLVGPKEHLETKLINLKEVNWLGDTMFSCEDKQPVRVKIRSTGAPCEALLRPTGTNTAKIELPIPESGVAPGQACVFYAPKGSRVLGGGWIDKN